MKKILLSLVLIMSFSLCAMSQELSFSKVITSETGVKKTQLYVAMRSFLATYYVNSKNVIQMEDKEAGLIIGKATSVYDAPGFMTSAYTGWLDYFVKLQTKDGKVRVEVTSFFHHNKPGNQAAANLGTLTTADEYATSGMQKGYHNKIWKDLKKQAEDISKNIFIEVESAVKKAATSAASEDNW